MTRITCDAMKGIDNNVINGKRRRFEENTNVHNAVLATHNEVRAVKVAVETTNPGSDIEKLRRDVDARLEGHAGLADGRGGPTGPWLRASCRSSGPRPRFRTPRRSSTN